MSKYGQRWGDPFGEWRTDFLYTDDASVALGVVRFAWQGGQTKWGYKYGHQYGIGQEMYWQIYVDGTFQVVTRDNEATLQVTPGQLNKIDLVAVGASNRDQDYGDVISQDGGGNRALIRWEGSTASDVTLYKMYWDQGSAGTINTAAAIASVAHTSAQTDYSYKSDILPDATYKFIVRASDGAENQESNVGSVGVTLAQLPDPVSTFTYSYTNSGYIVSLGWTDDQTASYHVYSNSGAASSFIDYDTTVASISAPTQGYTQSSLDLSKTWRFGVRVETTPGEEDNTYVDAVFELDSVGTLIEGQPNEPVTFNVEADTAASFLVTFRYDQRSESDSAAKFLLYYNSGGTASVDYGTALASVAKVTGYPVSYYSVSTTSFTNGVSYKFGIRAQTDGGIQDSNVKFVTDTADSVAPDAPTDITGAVSF